MNKFQFEFVKSIVRNDKRMPLTILCNCEAHLFPDGSVNNVDVEEMFFEGNKIPDNLIWMIDENLMAEIEEAAFQHADDKYFAIDTQPEYEN